ncbi:MAG: bis(5'-nucleosyl)-tetraphosphatase (symmetrical) YqeK [Eubacteriales bacterium]|nr:bis(5'-nucleosyl)-tetraphosphatase (symmetrical) YqeK [Eubacteriales bacterium]
MDWISMMNHEKMMERLKTNIKAKRFEHSLGVEYTAACLAYVHGADVEKARIAGLLHDCAKGIPTKEKLEKALKHGLPVNSFEKNNPDLLHAKLGAYYARYKYEIKDIDILNAITYHTTGRPDMSLLEKIIYVADYIEPNRKPIDELDIIRKEAFIDLNICIVHILKNTLEYLESTNTDIDIMTQKTYEYYVSNE